MSQAAVHAQISVTMPFCRHCGEPMPVDARQDDDAAWYAAANGLDDPT